MTPGRLLEVLICFETRVCERFEARWNHRKKEGWVRNDGDLSKEIVSDHVRPQRSLKVSRKFILRDKVGRQGAPPRAGKRGV